mgnify:CR=1 FL=1
MSDRQISKEEIFLNVLEGRIYRILIWQKDFSSYKNSWSAYKEWLTAEEVFSELNNYRQGIGKGLGLECYKNGLWGIIPYKRFESL